MTQPTTLPTSRRAIRPAPEIIVFEDPCKRRKIVPDATQEKQAKLKTAQSSSSSSNSKSSSFFDLTQARYEVRQLGIKGFDNAKKEDAVVSRLVKLGAKPPKKTYTNYKELQAKLKREKEELEMKKHNRELSLGKNKANAKVRTGRRSANDMGDGQIGRYVRGVQVLRSNDLKLVRSKISAKKKK